MGCLGWVLTFLGALVAVVSFGLAPLIYLPLLVGGIALVVLAGHRRRERHLEAMARNIAERGRSSGFPLGPYEPIRDPDKTYPEGADGPPR